MLVSKIQTAVFATSPALFKMRRMMPCVLTPIAVVILTACAQKTEHSLSQMKKSSEFALTQSLTTEQKGSWPDRIWWLR